MVTVDIPLTYVALGLGGLFLLAKAAPFLRRRFPAVRARGADGKEAVVVVTGCSTGIGRALAMDLHRAGFTVFAGVRKQADADSLAKEATALTDGGDGRGDVRPLLVDVADAASVERAVAEVRTFVVRSSAHLVGLVNNAGVSLNGPVEHVSVAKLRGMFEVNVFGLVAMTQGIVAIMRERPSAMGARIVNISSIAGTIARPFSGPYSSSKYAVEALSDALRREVHPWNMSVSVIQPGFIKTDISAKSAADSVAQGQALAAQGITTYAAHYEPDACKARAAASQGKAGTTRDVSLQAIHALTSEYPAPRYQCGGDSWAAAVVPHLPDWIVDRILASHPQHGWPGKHKVEL